MEKLSGNAPSVLSVWLIIMSAVLFIMMGADKKRARRRAYRIPEARLFLFAVLGGAVGGTLGMVVFRHKTKHWTFAVFFPLLAAVQVFILYKWSELRFLYRLLSFFLR